MRYHYVAWYHRHIPGFQVWQVRQEGGGGREWGSAGGGLAVRGFLVPVAFASLALLEEGPYEGVHNVGLVLLQPVAGPGDDVETEVIPDVDAARLGHLLLQEGVPLAPQQQHRGPDVVVAQGEGAAGGKGQKP